jgi:hypothetical protein
LQALSKRLGSGNDQECVRIHYSVNRAKPKAPDINDWVIISLGWGIVKPDALVIKLDDQTTRGRGLVLFAYHI